VLHSALSATFNLQVEAHAAQYGYDPQERKSLEQAYQDFLASADER